MSYDLYVELDGKLQQDVDALVTGTHRGVQVTDIATRIRLLAGIAAHNDQVKDYAVSGDRRQGGGYKSLVHMSDPKQTPYAKQIASVLKTFDLLKSSAPILATLPTGSWFLQFTFTLAKPWLSKDDDPFYVAESVNPVRKDKVFKVPMMSASSWKGLLRWTAMHVRLLDKKDTPDEFASERLSHTFLFGDEKGEEPGQTKDFAAYLDRLGGNEARRLYEQKLRAHFNLDEKAPLPHHSGRLMFYPTFFNSIDVEVINPHSRETRAGTHPIYLECVPAGACGTFSLLYVPFDLIGQEATADEITQQAKADLQLVAEAVCAMMLTYGFSAKRTSGYGTAQDEITDAVVRTRAGERKLTRLSKLAEEAANVAF